MVNINGKPDLYEISMALSNCTGLQNESTTMFIPWNETENQSHEARMEKIIHYYTMEISVPIVCAFGMIGNVLNFIVLTREKISHSLTKMEKSAHIGLIGLAISDFMFCLLAFMYTQIEFKDEYGVQNSVMYFEWLSGPLITWFILTSTWLTVSMAGERYLAVCHPFKARKLISLKKTRIITLIVYVMCLALSIPLIFEKTVVEHTNCEGYVYYKLETHPLFTDSVLGMRRLVWAILFDFIPCVALLYFNACLIYKIHHAKKLRNAMAPAQNQEVLLTKYPRELFSYNSDSATTNASVKTRQNASFHNSNSTKSHRTFNNKSWHCSPQHSSLKNSLPQKKQMRAKRRQTDYALNSVTATLVAVVVLFLVLVSPSEIIKFIYTVTVGTHTTTYKIILKITNLMQAVNFSVNFILYCGVNKSFRMSLAAIFCFFCRRGHRAFELRSLERAYCHRMEFSESES